MFDNHVRSWRCGGRLTVAQLMGLALVAAPAAYGGTVTYVDDDAAPGGDGLSWNTAFRFLQDALSAGPEVTEIRVAQGIYPTDRSEANPSGTGMREATFQLVSGLAVRGGYAGIGAGDPDARDIELYETVLSADLLGDDGPDFANNTENSYSVVTGSGTDNSALLEGFTVTGGNADAIHGEEHGGGLVNDNGSPTVSDCTFTANSALGGGGMHNFFSFPIVSHCKFIGNRADSGGGLQNILAGGSLTSCLFLDNTAIEGAGMTSLDSLAVVAMTGCVFSGNEASSNGGGIYIAGGSATVTCCTMSGNSAVSGGGLRVFLANVTLANSIVWGNAVAQILVESTGNLTISYCDIEGGEVGISVDGTSSLNWLAGNIEADPSFVDQVSGDYRLMPDSPCVDAAENTVVPPGATDDLDGNPRFIDNPAVPDTGVGDCPIVDMGAYEGQEGTTDCCPADLNGDGVVGFADLLVVLAAWGPCGDCPGDIDGDGTVGFADLLVLLAGWGPCSSG